MRVCSLCRQCYDDSVVSCIEEGHPEFLQAHNGDREMVPGYRLDLLMESAGKSEIYRATQNVSGQSCLIRVVDADETEGQQFLYEAAIAAAFFHPGVADIFETGLLKTGQHYI